MNELLKDDLLRPPRVGDIVEGKIIGKERGALFLDLGAIGTGIIYGKEFYEEKEKLKNLKIGDKIFAKITDSKNEKGFIELSLSGASRELAFDILRQKKEKDEVFKVKIFGANKGGLVSEVSGIPAFLPVSQLSSEHYPRVEGGETIKILQELQKFVGQELSVKILDFSQRDEQIILSEKATILDKKRETLKKYQVGDVVEGEITGVTDFGAFMRFDDLEGLIHISELDWKIIEDPTEVVQVGDRLKAKIIEIQNERVSLSLKAFKKDPWEGIKKNYQKGDMISGKVTKINPFGAFVQITPEIQGLCHVSEFEGGRMEDFLKTGEKYKFQILLIDEENHKMSLKLVQE